MANIYGTSGNDSVIGTSGDDRIYGEAGHDTLRGRGGADTFMFRPGHGHDKIVDFEPGTDIIDLSGFLLDRAVTWEALLEKMSTGLNFWVGSYVQIDLTEWGGGTITLIGIDSLDRLDESMFRMPSSMQTGGDGADTLTGANGKDLLIGGAGNDTLHGQGGDDMLHGGRGDDILHGGAGSDTIRGSQGDDRIVGGAGDDFLYGNDSDDGEGSDRDIFVFASGDGHDTIRDFTAGEDRIDLTAFDGIGGFGNIEARQDGGDVVIDLSRHGGGSITLSGVDLADLKAEDFVFRATGTVEGADANDILFGTAGRDEIKGHGGIDFIMGGQGDDRIEGGAGDDSLFGDGIDDGSGSDRDTFVFTPGGGNDRIGDFTDGEDAIDLTAFTGISGFRDLKVSQDGDNVVIDLSGDGGGSITLWNFDLDDLDGSDFIFHDASEPVDGV